MKKPQTRYTKSGSINIAYQVFGSGPIDLVYIPGWISNIDLMWDCPELVTFLEHLSVYARVILFDKRGTGLSDRVMELSPLEERMDDIRAVMDAVDSRRAVLFGHSEGGSVSALFAATYPERVISIIAFGIFAKRRYSKDYPWAPTVEERQKLYDMIEAHWGSGNMDLESLAPSKANDPAFMSWLSNYFRSGASPSAALVLTKMNTEVDIINILGSVQAPTLLLQRTHDIDVKIEEGKFIAERIPNARFVELEGVDHLFWAGDLAPVLREIVSFLGSEQQEAKQQKRLMTLVGARYFSANGNRKLHMAEVDRLAKQYRGLLVQTTNQGFVLAFDGPSKAVHCCFDILRAPKLKEAKLAFGINTEEVFVNGTLVEETVGSNFLNNLLDHGQANDIIVSETTKYLLSGTGLTIDHFKWVLQNESGNALELFEVKHDDEVEYIQDHPHFTPNPKGDSFLERVLQCIHNRLGDETFSIKDLSGEIGLSERQLQRKVKSITNKSPNQLISSVRLHKAKELLMNPEYNISEVAYMTGFSNPSYFSQSFKKEFGLSPSSVSNSY